MLNTLVTFLLSLLFSQLDRQSDTSSSSGNKDQKIKSGKKSRLSKPWIENAWMNYTLASYYEKFQKRKQRVLCRPITECAISTAICYKDMTVQLWYVVRSKKMTTQIGPAKRKKNPLTSLKSCFTPPSPRGFSVPPYHLLNLYSRPNLSCKMWWFVESKPELQLSQDTRENRLSNGQ